MLNQDCSKDKSFKKAINLANQPLQNARTSGHRESMVQAWDVPTRLFHWLLAGLIVSAALTRHFGGLELYWHKLNGYMILTLLVYRVMWGFVGGSTARFRAFVRWPSVGFEYGRDMLQGHHRKYLGHNPLGGWMVVMLLLVLFFQTVTGLFSNDDALAEGPLVKLVSYDMSGYLTGLHHTGFKVILILTGIHVTVNLLYRFWMKDDLITPMVTGRKTCIQYEDEHRAQYGSIYRALVCLGLAAGLVFGGIKIVGGALF